MYNTNMLKRSRLVVVLVLFLLLSLLIQGTVTSTALSTPQITIRSPGDGSTVTSPIAISAEVLPGGDGLLRITLVDDTTTMLSRKLLRLSGPAGKPITFSTNLSFELPHQNDEALLTLSTQDEFHRPLSARSVFLTLQADGTATLHPTTSGGDWLNLTSPQPGESFSGGQVLVAGSVTPVVQNPVIFELVTDSGGVVGSLQRAVQEPGTTLDFEFTLPYAFITTTRDVRLVVRQSAPIYLENVILDSITLSLAP